MRAFACFALLAAWAVADTFAPLDDSTFGREIKSKVTPGFGVSYAKATHPWYDLAPYDVFQFRLRLLSDAGDFSPVLRGIYADIELAYGNTLLTPKTWTVALWNLFAVNCGFSFRASRREKAFFPYLQFGVGYNSGSTRSGTTNTLRYDGCLFYQAKAGVEWVILAGFLSLGPGISLSHTPYAYDLVTDPVWSVGFVIDLHFYIL